MKSTAIFFVVVCDVVICAIRSDTKLNKLLRVKPVGKAEKTFVPLTEIPPPQMHNHGGRRHLPEECTTRTPIEVVDAGNVDIVGEEYYDDEVAKTMATVIMPDHIDYKHFEVTTQVPYLTLGYIEGIGYHHTTIKQSECERIYDEHLEEMYSEESESEESMEMARMPLARILAMPPELEQKVEDQYDV